MTIYHLEFIEMRDMHFGVWVVGSGRVGISGRIAEADWFMAGGSGARSTKSASHQFRKAP